MLSWSWCWIRRPTFPGIGPSGGLKQEWTSILHMCPALSHPRAFQPLFPWPGALFANIAYHPQYVPTSPSAFTLNITQISLPLPPAPGPDPALWGGGCPLSSSCFPPVAVYRTVSPSRLCALRAEPLSLVLSSLSVVPCIVLVHNMCLINAEKNEEERGMMICAVQRIAFAEKTCTVLRNPSWTKAWETMLISHLPYWTQVWVFFFKILFLSNLNTQCEAWTHNPEIKICTLATEPARHPQVRVFLIGYIHTTLILHIF